MQKFTVSAIMILILTRSLSTAAQDKTSQNTESLALHCFEKPFVSASVRTRSRDVVPAVKLSLTDPLGRSQGERTRSPQIPASSYGEVVQIPRLPDRSRALAIEVCDAEQGVYKLRVEEHGDEPYVLDVTAEAPNADITPSLLLHHIAQKGRIGHYRFRLRITNGQVDIKWLDRAGQERMRIEDNEW
jgi:hypothetical protein